MSRKPAIIKVVNLEDGMPKVEQARLRMQHDLAVARSQGVVALKLIHGYGSSGTGGALRNELQKDLRRAGTEGKITCFIPGEEWTISDEATWSLLKKFPRMETGFRHGQGQQGDQYCCPVNIENKNFDNYESQENDQPKIRRPEAQTGQQARPRTAHS
jgi:hypothetical protein